MQLRIMSLTPKIQAVLTALEKISLDERGRAFHAIPTISGNLVLTEEVLAEEYPGCGVLVVSARPLEVSGGEGTAFFGLREWKAKDLERLERESRRFTMREISMDGLADLTDAVMAKTRSWKKVHLILDMSVVDPVFLGVSEGIPGGLSSREFIYLVQRLSMLKHLATVEVVLSSGDGLESSLVAKVIAELL